MKKTFSKKINGVEILSRLQDTWKKGLSVLCFCFFLHENHKFAKFTMSSVIDSGDDLWKINEKKNPTTDVKHTRGGSLSLCQ